MPLRNQQGRSLPKEREGRAMTDKIIDLALLTDDAKAWTPSQMLKEAQRRVGPGGDCEHVKKAIVIYLDDEDGIYGTAWNESGMKCSEMVTLLEVVKNGFIDILKGE